MFVLILSVWILGISCLQAPATEPSAPAEKSEIATPNPVAGQALSDNFQKNARENAVSLYNQAADRFSKGETDQAFLLFERACANYIYLPACRALQRAGEPFPLALLIWSVIFIIYAFFTLILIGFLSFSKKGAGFKTRAASFVAWTVLLLTLNQASSDALLRPGGRALQSCELQTAPIEGALAAGSLKKGEGFSSLKNHRNKWFKIKTESGQSGWVSKERLYWTKD